MRKIKLAEKTGSLLYKKIYSMALVSANDELVHNITGCRDYLQDIIRAHVRGKTLLSEDTYGIGALYVGKKAPDVCFDKLCLLICITDNETEFIPNMIRTLNIIEEYAGIQKSVINEVSVNTSGKSFLVEGSHEYAKNGFLLSALTFILRFIFRNRITDKFDSAQDFINKINEFSKEEHSFTKKDMHIAIDCKYLLLEILKDRKEIFKGMGLTDLFPEDISASKHHTLGGIASLCVGKSHTKKLNDRILARM